MLDIRELMNLKEAYNAVYAPQELTEEQVWEEVETWVNSLIEEGYDLSDYTWEEMYESYIEEATVNLKPQKGVTAGGNVTLGRGYEATLGGKKGQLSYVRGSQGRLQRTFRELGSEANPPSAAQAKQDQVGSPPPRPAAGSPPPRPAAGSPPPRPAAATAAPKPTPAATAAPKPTPAATAAPKPATGMLGKTSFERRTPTSVELKAAQAARAGGEKNPEKVLQAAKASSAPAAGNTLSQTTAAASKPAAFSPTPAATSTPAGNTLSQTTAAASKPAAFSPTPAAKSTLKKPIVSSFDMFDIVKGYLIGEGYADTNESALVIMANMSEEWRQSIVEGVGGYDDPVLGPKTPLGQAARKVGKVVVGAARGAVKGAMGTTK
jgi:hypothetical protein